MTNHTIAAISTPAGYGGIGIIKLSGPDAIPISLSVFKPRHVSTDQRTVNGSCPEDAFPVSRHFYYGHVIDDNLDRHIDEALFVVMRGPRSYTGEDVVEIQTHSGPFVLKTILTALIQKGVRLADPGEFTRRAFLNGRMDLTQAEAVIDIINARSARSIDLAMSLVAGGLKQEIECLRDSIWTVLSFVEALIDFPDDMDGESDAAAMISSLEKQVIPQIQTLIARHDEQHFLRDGLKVVIAGGPNVGKSSLMNRLINKERSIVTDIPGTTRDFIEESFTAKGVSIVLTDTAGIRDNPDSVEQIGIEKAWEAISGADIVLYALDAGKAIHVNDLSLFERLANKKMIIVINKTDLPDDHILLSLPNEWVSIETVRISALYNLGIDDLKEKIAQMSFSSEVCSEQNIVPNLRHKQCLEKSLQSVEDARSGFLNSIPIEMISIDLRSAMDALSEITGEVVKPDILDAIFSRFCIGK